ncbi:MAG: M16 family metallopeptidase [Bacteroidota bacterium]
MTIRPFLSSSILCLLLATTSLAQAPDRSERPATGPFPTLELPPIQTRTFTNGLEVMHMAKHDLPLVQLNVILEVGSVDDPADLPGLASLTAAMIDEGAGDLDALELQDAFEFLGARFFVSSGHHHTILGLRAPASRFDEAVSLLGDVLLRPHFAGDELERLRIERLTSLIRRHDDPSEIASTLFDRILYGEEHPYGRAVLGDEAFLRNVGTEDVRDFYQRLYVPSRARVVMAGDIDESVMAAVERTLAVWEGPVEERRILPPAGQVEGLKIFLVDRPGAAQSIIRIGRIGVPRDVEDYYALNIMNTILGGSFTSRLNQNLREDKGYTYGAGSSFDFRPFPGPFSAGAAVFTDVTAEALQEFINELRGIGEPLPEEEIDRARNFLAMRFPQNFQSVSRIAGQLGELAMYDLPHDYLTRYTERILATDEDDVEAAARRYVDPENLTIIIVGDQQAIEAKIRALEVAPVEVMEITDVLGALPVLTDAAGR